MNMTDRLTQLQKLHAADPGDSFCTYGIALEYAKAGNPKEALTWLDKTLVLNPKECYAYYQKAKMLIQLDEREQAKDVLRAGLAVAMETGESKARNELSGLLETV